MLKQKKYDWKDTNMALFGSDLEKKIKKAAAQGEPQWKNVGKHIELRIWRIVDFRVTEWPIKQYGYFYEGDSYIILNTYLKIPESKAFSYDIHFWIGEYSTQDEYGTAAYKAVELDHMLGDVAVQHREVMGNETSLFLGYFPKGIKLMQGGADSGFTHVEVNAGVEIPPTLWWVKGNKDKISLREAKLSRHAMNSGDVFILDKGTKVWQWNGKTANNFEKLKAAEFVRALKHDRGGRTEIQTLTEDVDDHEEQAPEFCAILPTKQKMLGLIDVQLDVQTEDQGTKVLSNIHLDWREVCARYASFFPTALIRDHSSSAPKENKANVMTIAHNYMKDYNRPHILPISSMVEHHETKDYESFFDPNIAKPSTCSCVIM